MTYSGLYRTAREQASLPLDSRLPDLGGLHLNHRTPTALVWTGQIGVRPCSPPPRKVHRHALDLPSAVIYVTYIYEYIQEPTITRSCLSLFIFRFVSYLLRPKEKGPCQTCHRSRRITARASVPALSLPSADSAGLHDRCTHDSATAWHWTFPDAHRIAASLEQDHGVPLAVCINFPPRPSFSSSSSSPFFFPPSF